jgi:hypothetical protein
MLSSTDTQLSLLRSDVKDGRVPQMLHNETMLTYHARLATLYKLSAQQVAVELGE